MATKHERRSVPSHQPATMTVDCPVCGVRAGHQCKNRKRQAERTTHAGRVAVYRTVSRAARRTDDE